MKNEKINKLSDDLRADESFESSENPKTKANDPSCDELDAENFNDSSFQASTPEVEMEVSYLNSSPDFEEIENSQKFQSDFEVSKNPRRIFEADSKNLRPAAVKIEADAEAEELEFLPSEIQAEKKLVGDILESNFEKNEAKPQLPNQATKNQPESPNQTKPQLQRYISIMGNRTPRKSKEESDGIGGKKKLFWGPKIFRKRGGG